MKAQNTVFAGVSLMPGHMRWTEGVWRVCFGEYCLTLLMSDGAGAYPTYVGDIKKGRPDGRPFRSD